MYRQKILEKIISDWFTQLILSIKRNKISYKIKYSK